MPSNNGASLQISTNSDDGQACAASCFEPDDGHMLIVCRNNHRMHLDCIQQWISNNLTNTATCPLCREGGQMHSLEHILRQVASISSPSSTNFQTIPTSYSRTRIRTSISSSANPNHVNIRFQRPKFPCSGPIIVDQPNSVKEAIGGGNWCCKLMVIQFVFLLMLLVSIYSIYRRIKVMIIIGVILSCIVGIVWFTTTTDTITRVWNYFCHREREHWNP